MRVVSTHLAHDEKNMPRRVEKQELVSEMFGLTLPVMKQI